MWQDVQWIVEPFVALNAMQVHQMLQLRQQVFVVEQNSVYLDADNEDLNATHVMAYDGAKLVAYARIVAPHLSRETVKIGRVVVASSWRSQGLGQQLFQMALDTAKRQYPNLPIVIAAQVQAQTWYEAFGFVAEGEVFDDGGVKHVTMRLVD